MIQRIGDVFDHFSYFNAWIFMGMLSVLFKSHPWHGNMPAFDKFYLRYKDDTMISLYVRISTAVLLWIILFFSAMLIFF